MASNINLHTHWFTNATFFLIHPHTMSYFTWKETGLTSDCSSLEAMAARFEEAAKLMRRMAKEGFELNRTKDKQLIKHKNHEIFNDWGFISEEQPYKQLELIKENEME